VTVMAQSSSANNGSLVRVAAPSDFSTYDPKVASAAVALPNRRAESRSAKAIDFQVPQWASVTVECESHYLTGTTRTQKTRPLWAASAADSDYLAGLKLFGTGLPISDTRDKPRLRNHSKRHKSVP
jgi:hypothetical protein